jgi:hypothetical protein
MPVGGWQPKNTVTVRASGAPDGAGSGILQAAGSAGRQRATS